MTASLQTPQDVLLPSLTACVVELWVIKQLSVHELPHSAPPFSTSPSPKKHHTEGMAILQPLGEHGHVIFENVDGKPRVNCTMLDPGVSAFLMGSGPFYRYAGHLKSLGYPIETIEMQRTSRPFHFASDHSTTNHWIVKIPVFVNSVMGFAHAFIIKGETPMLMGRPIIEKFGLIVNFKRKTIMFKGHPWSPLPWARWVNTCSP